METTASQIMLQVNCPLNAVVSQAWVAWFLPDSGKGRPETQINVNTIAPLAGSRITEGVMPPALLDALKPEYVSPFVAFLCHQNCTETGSIFELGAGFCAKLRWERAEGALLRVDHPTFNPSAISAVIYKGMQL